MIVCQGNAHPVLPQKLLHGLFWRIARQSGDNVRMKYFRIEATLNTRLQKPKNKK
jgi:hypothetical protein